MYDEEHGLDIEVVITDSADDGIWSQVEVSGDGSVFFDDQVEVGYSF